MIPRRQVQTVLLSTVLLVGYAFHVPLKPTVNLASIRSVKSAMKLFPNSKQAAIPDDNVVDADKIPADDGQDMNKIFSSFMKNVLPQPDESAFDTVTESIDTEEEKLKQLKIERLAEIEAGEIRRQQRVSEDKLAYLFIFLLQFLPLFPIEKASILYFFGLAVTTVYLGGRQEVIDVPEKISNKSALYAPVFASVSIGLLYCLLKIGIDPTSLYAIGVTLFGALALSDVGVPILRNIFPQYDFSNAEVEVPKGLAKLLDLDKPSLPVDGLITLGIGVFCALIYWTPIALEQKFLVSNVIAWALGMVSLGAISLGSYQTGALFLGGLFCYDVFWV